ncbi:MAG: preprotein translocase subunit SecY [Paludibacteraceae bacterium]|nr:preprotein translocase subunit SecY [Paludibacteraceae bacterium]
MNIVSSIKNWWNRSTLHNIFAIEELRGKILTTLLFVLIYRFGSFVVLPGIDTEALSGLREQTSGGLMSLLDMFSGGAFSNASIFALGIMPYISASIVVQLLTLAIPYFQKMQRDGENGMRRLNQVTRVLTVFILLLQGPAYLTNLSYQLRSVGAAMPAGIWFSISSTIILCAGSMFVMWLGERITDKGIGNGISLLIMIGIIARLPNAFAQEFLMRMNENGGGGLIFLLAEVVVLLFIVAACIALVQATRKIPIQYAKRIVGNRQMGGVREYLPLKVNAAGVMPIIFAQAIMMIPIMLAGFNSENVGKFMRAFMDNTGIWYNLVFAFLIIVFTYFYTAITVNSTSIAEHMKANNGFIPGVKPGKASIEFIDNIMDRITLPGSIFLAIVAILPAIASIFGVTREFAQFYGGTSLLILVGVILDTLQQIETHLSMHHYDGVLKSGGRIKGRMGSVAAY